MTFSHYHSTEILERTPVLLSALLRSLSAFWIEAKEGEEGWSAKEIVAHLSLCEETNWMPRIKTILQKGTSEPFVPIDMKAHLPHARLHSMEELLDEFLHARTQSVNELKELKLEDWQYELEGRHPVVGPVRLRELIATWVTHDMSHIAQIARIFAKQNQAQVGPFAVYLTLLSNEK